MRYLTGLILVIAAGVGCSQGAERPAAASPTSPTATVSADSAVTFVGGVSGPMDVLFPGRNDSFQFRNDLETKYQQMGRSLTSTFVDREGEVVWTQEYIRYRVNGCDHPTAVARVMTQIDGGVAGGICGSPPEGLIVFPSRADSLQFRRELETKYQQMGRGLQSTFVDQEGAVIWIQEYLRYRVNGCDHATAESKVFSQIDGGPVPATCFVACEYGLSPTAATIEYTPANLSFQVRPNPGGCAWQASSDASWLTFPDELRNGNGLSTFPYSVAQNNSTFERTGRIRFTWTGGGADFTVTQRGIPVRRVVHDVRSVQDDGSDDRVLDSQLANAVQLRRQCQPSGRQLQLSVAHLVRLRDREGDLADCQHTHLLVFRLMRRHRLQCERGNGHPGRDADNHRRSRQHHYPAVG